MLLNLLKILGRLSNLEIGKIQNLISLAVISVAMDQVTLASQLELIRPQPGKKLNIDLNFNLPKKQPWLRDQEGHVYEKINEEPRQVPASPFRLPPIIMDKQENQRKTGMEDNILVPLFLV